MSTALLTLAGVGKDYAKVESRGGRLRLVFDLLRGHGAAHVFRALDDVSFSMARGESLGIIGENGAGKSTLFQLVQRFYDPQSGEIRLDGVPLTRADPNEIRSRIAVVPQETVVFAASALENIRYGRPSATEAEVWAAAEAAHADVFLRALPDGIHSYLGEAGTRLSGGAAPSLTQRSSATSSARSAGVGSCGLRRFTHGPGAVPCHARPVCCVPATM